MSKNRQWLLKQRPRGMVGPEHFEPVASDMPRPDFSRGEVLLKTRMLGFDPAMRGWIIDEPSYLPPVQLGEVMRSTSVCEVVASQSPELPEGMLVRGMTGWQEYCVAGPGSAMPPEPLPQGMTPEMALSVMGFTTLTAYFGLLEIGQPKPGDTVVVSGAAGATGSAVAQIAKLKDCRVIGIAGGEEKCRWLRESCGIDELIDYRSEDVASRLQELCPLAINVFFDNVGGATLEAVIGQMADFGRIALCGAISAYNDAEPGPGPRNLMTLVRRRIRMQGFIVLDFLDRYQAAMAEIGEWVRDGKIAWRADVQQGFENIPATLQRLFSGANQGKQLLELP